MNVDLTKTQSLLVKKINKKGQIWVVGGTPRDLILKRKPKDVDFATNLRPDQVITIIKQLKLTRIPDATAYHHGITRVVDKQTGEIVDIATTRSDTRCDGRWCVPVFTNNIEEDLARRDFTINAIALEIDYSGNILKWIDPYDGASDLTKGRITWVGNTTDRIKEDYLRLIRMCRFAALFPTPTYQKHNYKQYAKHISNISKERVRDEIIKSLSYPVPSNFWRLMYDFGILDVVFPELTKCVECSQNVHHDYEPVWDHLLRTLDSTTELTDKPMLKLAAVLHDVGKPETRTIDNKYNVHFFKHEVRSAEIAYSWMKQYRFSSKECEYVSKVCRFHQWRFTDETKDKTIKKWLQKVGKDVWEDLITIRCADRKGNISKQNHPMMTKEIWSLYKKIKSIIDTKQPLFKEDLVINGEDLIALGVKPGPVYKKIFNNLIYMVVADPTKNTREYLLSYVKQQAIYG